MTLDPNKVIENAEGLVPYDSAAETLRHIKRVAELLGFAAVELIARGMIHDNSKLMEPEKAYFDTYTPRLKDLQYGSDEYRQCLVEMKPALEHHNSVNTHHPEHFGELGVAGMTLFDLLEMFLDWKAASERHTTGDILRSIEVNTERFKLDPQVAAILRNTADWITTLPLEPRL